MKNKWMLAMVLSLSLAAAAEEGANTTSEGAAQQQNLSSQRSAKKRSTSPSSTKTDGRSHEPADPTKLSPGFEVAGLGVITRIRAAERRISNSIKMSFPLGEAWIQEDREAIDDSLRLAASSARNDADRDALLQLESQSDRLRKWSDWLLDQNRQLRLATYYVSPSALDDDEQLQKITTCTKSLMLMLTSGRVSDGSACR